MLSKFLCALLAKLNKLHSENGTSVWNNLIDTLRILCKQEPESNFHLFFKCSYSNSIWESYNYKTKLKLPISINGDTDEVLNVVFNRSKNKKFCNKLIDIVITTIIWHIWVERNMRIFQRIESPIHIRAELIMIDCKHLLKRTNIREDEQRG